MNKYTRTHTHTNYYNTRRNVYRIIQLYFITQAISSLFFFHNRSCISINGGQGRTATGYIAYFGFPTSVLLHEHPTTILIHLPRSYIVFAADSVVNKTVTDRLWAKQEVWGPQLFLYPRDVGKYHSAELVTCHWQSQREPASILCCETGLNRDLRRSPLT
jgi:hypothetical protein